MTVRALEALACFLANHGRVWKAHCASMGVDGEQIAKELIRQHRKKLTPGQRNDLTGKRD